MLTIIDGTSSLTLPALNFGDKTEIAKKNINFTTVNLVK